MRSSTLADRLGISLGFAIFFFGSVAWDFAFPLAPCTGVVLVGDPFLAIFFLVFFGTDFFFWADFFAASFAFFLGAFFAIRAYFL
jgi:hypothetical protein